ncbi:MAG: replication initiation protein [Magnetovibrio sp.]|nr:replication initiation protein [Magnetovibrio sp.]
MLMLRKRAEDVENGISIKEVHSLKNNKVTTDNSLARAYYTYTLNEKQIMASIISKINSTNESYNSDHGIYISFDSFQVTYQFASLKNAKRAMLTGLQGLYDKDIKNLEGFSKGNHARLITSHFDNLADGVRFFLNIDLLPYLQGLKQRFTSYQLKETCNFESSYTWRLYELLLSWISNGDGHKKLHIEELQKTLGIPESYTRSNINKVIKKGVDEINSKSDLTVEYDTHKESRRISGYHFFMYV